VVHQPVSRGFAVFADAWLSVNNNNNNNNRISIPPSVVTSEAVEISADLRENGSALKVVLHDYALYKSTFTLLYFTMTLT